MHLDKTSISHTRDRAGMTPGRVTDTTTGCTRARTQVRAVRAALFTAVAALSVMNMGVSPALANDGSSWPCTAGDVEIVGTGNVINEPCAPGSSFNAVVKFTVRNNTSSPRYCVALHVTPDGVVVTGDLDITLRDANGSSTAGGRTGSERYHDTVMYGTIPNFPANGGKICFGQPGVVRGQCAPGTCTTISWNTSSSAANCTVPDQNPPGGQCRHQQICVVGFGASLSCAPNCVLQCGATGTLRACALAPADRGPFTLTLTGSDGSSQTQSVFGDASGVTCLDFNVIPGRYPTTDYTLTVTDKDGCFRTATSSLTVTGIPTSGAGLDQTKCAAGATTPFTLAGSSTNGTATWSVVSGPASIANPSSLSSGVTFTGIGVATLRLSVANGPCPVAQDDVVLRVNGNPTAGAGSDQTKCTQGETTSFTLAGSATYGNASWSVVSGPVAIANPNTLNSGVTFTGTGSATLRLTVTSTANPQCPTATDDVVLTVSPTTVAIASANPGCNGVLVYTASVNRSGCGFTWTIDGKSPAEFVSSGAADDARVARVSGSGNATFAFRALDNLCHVIRATTSCPDEGATCTGVALTTARQCVGTSSCEGAPAVGAVESSGDEMGRR